MIKDSVRQRNLTEKQAQTIRSRVRTLNKTLRSRQPRRKQRQDIRDVSWNVEVPIFDTIIQVIWWLQRCRVYKFITVLFVDKIEGSILFSLIFLRNYFHVFSNSVFVSISHIWQTNNGISNTAILFKNTG